MVNWYTISVKKDDKLLYIYIPEGHRMLKLDDDRISLGDILIDGGKMSIFPREETISYLPREMPVQIVPEVDLPFKTVGHIIEYLKNKAENESIIFGRLQESFRQQLARGEES